MKNISARNMRSYHEQYWYAEHVLTDFLDIDNSAPLNICEIGPAEGGALKYFAERGHRCFGIEFSDNRHENSIILNDGLNIKLIKGDITRPDTYSEDINEKMDVIICRDVIEHIDQDKKLTALRNMTELLKPGGRIFLSFPPKYSPYAGHQQTAASVWVKLPYIFLLPDKIYAAYLKFRKISSAKIEGLLRVKSNRISINNFEKIVKSTGLELTKRQFYIIRPAHENRYKTKRIKQPFGKIFREWLSTGALYCLKKN